MTKSGPVTCAKSTVASYSPENTPRRGWKRACYGSRVVGFLQRRGDPRAQPEGLGVGADDRLQIPTIRYQGCSVGPALPSFVQPLLPEHTDGSPNLEALALRGVPRLGLARVQPRLGRAQGARRPGAEHRRPDAATRRDNYRREGHRSPRQVV